MKNSGVVFAVCVFFLLFPAFAGAADVKALLGEANTLFRSADKDFMSGKFDTAWESVQKAKETISLAKEADPSNSQVVSLERRIDQLAEKIAKRKEAAGAKTGAAGAGASGEAPPARLPATATRYLRESDRPLAQIESMLGAQREKYTPESLVRRVKEQLQTVEQNIGKLLDEYGEFKDHPEVVARIRKMEAAQQELATLEKTAEESAAAEAEAKAGREAESGEWLRKLRPYVASKSRMDDAPYLDPEKEMLSYAGFDITPEELAKRHGIHGEAAALLEEYRSAGVKEPLDLLAETEKEIESRLGQFSSALRNLGNSALGDARTQLDWGKKFIEENVPKAQKGEDFNLLGRDVLARIQSSIDSAAVFLPAEDEGLSAARSDMETLTKEADALRELRVEKIRMLPDRFSGPDEAEIRAAAEEAVVKEHPGTSLLRMNIISAEWKNDWRFQEGADRIVRLVMTRQVSVQAAVKKGSDVLLLTVGVYSRSLPDWSWGPLKGYVMFTDKMLEENVEK